VSGSILGTMVRAHGGLDAASADARSRIEDQLVELNALAKSAIDGAPDAVRSFLHAISPTIRRTCRGVLGAGHPDLEDAIQDCLVDVNRALPRYRFEGHPLHYVTKIAIRRAIALRRRGVARTRQLGRLEILQDEAPVGDPRGGEVERSEIVREVVRRLNPQQAEALLLRVVLGFSVDEIASISGAPVNTVKTRLRLAKNALRRFLDGAPPAPSTGGAQETPP
jgi:RNA polymerase sigma factor (sigma-70 family)